MFSANLMQGALNEKKYREALQYAEKARIYLAVQPYPVLQIRVDSMSWLAYTQMGDLARAMDCLIAFHSGKEKMVSGQQKEQLDKMALTLDVKEKDLTIAKQNLDIVSKKRRIAVLSLLFVIAVLIATDLFVYFLRLQSFRR